MAMPVYIIRPAARCLRNPRNQNHFLSLSFSTTVFRHDEASLETTSNSTPPPPPDPSKLIPYLITTRKEEHLLAATGRTPIGSRRRRAALQSTSNIPFEQLPYQCFQEARKILAADREKKLVQIEEERKRIKKVQQTPIEKLGGEASKKGKLVAMQKYLEELKILADINDPLVKKRFEDGMGDMNRPIYRHLADKQWRQYRRKVQLQRITQMHVVPDLLPHIDPVAEVTLAFGRHNIQPGAFVDSRMSAEPVRLSVQVFDKGPRLVSVVVVDPDVPNPETDGFDSRCHFLAINISVAPTATSLPLAKFKEGDSQLVLPWLPPYAQKGSPYHRLSVFVLQHRDGQPLDHGKVMKSKRDGFSLRAFTDRFKLQPVGVALFRIIWDEGTAGVMEKAGIEGVNVEFVRKRPEKLPFKKKDGARYRGYRKT